MTIEANANRPLRYLYSSGGTPPGRQLRDHGDGSERDRAALGKRHAQHRIGMDPGSCQDARKAHPLGIRSCGAIPEANCEEMLTVPTAPAE